MLNPWPEMMQAGRRRGGQPHPQSFHVCHLVSLGGLTQITIWKLHEASISAAESIQNGVCNWEFPNHSRQGWVKDVLLLIHPANNNNGGHSSASSPFARYSSLRLELVLSGPRIWIIWIFPRGNQHDPLAKRLQRRSPYQIPVSCENSCAPVEAIMRIRTQKEKAQHVTQKHIAAHRSTSTLWLKALAMTKCLTSRIVEWKSRLSKKRVSNQNISKQVLGQVNHSQSVSVNRPALCDFLAASNAKSSFGSVSSLGASVILELQPDCLAECTWFISARTGKRQPNANRISFQCLPHEVIWRCFKSVLSLERSTMVPLNLRLKKHKKQITVALLSMVWTFLFHYPSVEQLFNIHYMSLQPTRAEQDLPHVQAFGVALENLHMRSAMRSRLSARLMKSHPAPCFKNPHTCKTQRGFQIFQRKCQNYCFNLLRESPGRKQGWTGHHLWGKCGHTQVKAPWNGWLLR